MTGAIDVAWRITMGLAIGSLDVRINSNMFPLL